VDYPTKKALKKINTLSTTQLEKADIDNGYELNCLLDSKKIEIKHKESLGLLRDSSV